jgi:hypothetical protein
MSSPTVTIATIVEGDGEVSALPKLLYRLAEQFSVYDLRMPRPMRVPKGKLKEWLTKQRADGPPYKPTVDQATLASVFDIGQARSNSPSFDKFCRDAQSLLIPGLSPGTD